MTTEKEQTMELWELAAREGVRDCIAKYNAYGDSGRLDEMIEVFAEDAVMEMDGDAYTGRAAIRDIMTSSGRGFIDFAKRAGTPRDAPLVRHYTSTIVITVDSPTTAHAELYYVVLMFRGIDHWGRYVDDYVCVDGEWKIARRQEWMDGASQGGFGAEHMVRLGRSGYGT